MVAYILLGDDQVTLRSRRAALAAASAAGPAHSQTFDLSDEEHADRALSLLTMPSMFAEARLLDLRSLDAVDAEYAVRLREAVMATSRDDTILMTGTRLAEAVKRALVGITTETYSAAPGTLPRRLQTLAHGHQITLTEDAVSAFVDVCGDDLALAASILYALAVVGIDAPTGSHVRRFSGPATTSRGTAWGIGDALASGDIRTALSLADGVEPLAVLSYLGTRMGQLGRTVETPLYTAEEVAGAFGIPNLAAARRLLEHADRLGPAGVAASWRMLAAADVAVKASPTPRVAFDAFLVQLSRVWASTTPEPVTAHRPAPRQLPVS